VANPGCYATSVILALAPFAKKAKTIVVDSCSGVSGAGNTPSEFNIFCNAAEDVVAYDATRHKHLAEMQQELGAKLVFTPHLVPMNRGILSTSHLFFNLSLTRSEREHPSGLAPDASQVSNSGFNEPVSQKQLEEELETRYAGKKFVKIVKKPEKAEKDWLPSARMARGTNNCLIGAEADEEHSAAVIVSAIDNLVKGAAGQAIQNANLMLGLKEDEGLPVSPVFP